MAQEHPRGPESPDLNLVRSQSSVTSPLTHEEYEDLAKSMRNDFQSSQNSTLMSQGLSREALLSTPQPSTSHAQGDSDQVEPNLWTNLTNPHGPHPILRQDTLETNPICVDPNTSSRIPISISQIP